ncbi:unnamed protein product [Cuscuta europaea]|uniref:Uncharacterized protein n=1 Tax=Cuscuta europaea TaxID=41803 RepID=A0A9P1E213_CUSEU|nr:unnamed protein product [Cuscuta europaea]
MFKKLTRLKLLCDKKRDHVIIVMNIGFVTIGAKEYFIVEIVSDELGDAPETQIRISLSLNTMTGFGSYSTMQLDATLFNPSMTVLDDSGSTHNFIHQRLVPMNTLQQHPGDFGGQWRPGTHHWYMFASYVPC